MVSVPKAVMHPHFKWGLVVLLLIILFFFLFKGEPDPPATPDPEVPAAPEGTDPGGEGASLPTEDLSSEYLAGYGEEDVDPARDLALVHDLLEAFRYSVKVPDALPTSGNRDLVTALTGKNPFRIRFLDPASTHLNGQGELVDRWGTPLYFHFVASTEVGIRSAGPDRAMWTPDDIRHGAHADALQ